MFPSEFNITAIDRIIYVSAEEYPKSKTSFSGNTLSNELIFNLTGESTVFFNGKKLHNCAGNIRFLPSGIADEYLIYRTQPGNCIDICFHTDVSLADEAFIININDNEKIKKLFRVAFSFWSGKKEGYYLKCMEIIYKIIYEINTLTYIGKGKYKKIEPAITYISENYYSTTISIPYLAQICDISESYLKRIFNELYGISPKKYILRLRVEYAIELIESKMYSIGRIAELMGFDNVYYFSNFFKKEIGVSPAQYSEKCKSSR